MRTAYEKGIAPPDSIEKKADSNITHQIHLKTRQTTDLRLIYPLKNNDLTHLRPIFIGQSHLAPAMYTRENQDLIKHLIQLTAFPANSHAAPRLSTHSLEKYSNTPDQVTGYITLDHLFAKEDLIWTPRYNSGRNG